jgi:hypothetical protein
MLMDRRLAEKSGRLYPEQMHCGPQYPADRHDLRPGAQPGGHPLAVENPGRQFHAVGTDHGYTRTKALPPDGVGIDVMNTKRHACGATHRLNLLDQEFAEVAALATENGEFTHRRHA